MVLGVVRGHSKGWSRVGGVVTVSVRKGLGGILIRWRWGRLRKCRVRWTVDVRGIRTIGGIRVLLAVTRGTVLWWE